MALVVPVLVMVMFGAADLGRAFYMSIEIAGASRSGMRTGIIGGTNDIGAAVRSEPYNAIDNTAATWGSTGPGQPYDSCNNPAGPCGDPSGCDVASAFNGSSRIACFAVRTCTVDQVNGGCSSYSQWGIRPSEGTGNAVQVLVVYKFTPVTPLISSFAGSTGTFYLRNQTTGVELY